MKLKTLALTALTALSAVFADDSTDTLELNSRIDVVQDTQILKDKGYAVWGGSTIKGDDGKYHMFYARWKGNGLGGWQTKSTIAYAVSDSPYGPFKHVKTVLQGSGDKFRWDYNNAHNPHIKKFGDHYYLYYIAAYDWKGKINSKGRNRGPLDFQNVGVIKFKSMKEIVDGTFKVPDLPIITADNVNTFNRNVNPSVTKGPDGRYYAAMKCRGDADGGGGFIHWIMVSDAPDKPFKVFSKMLTHKQGAEDPYMWYDQKRKRFYAVVKEFGSGKLAPEHGALALLTSVDGRDWKGAKNSIVTLKRINRPDGKQYKVGYTDRPQLVFDENGTIIALNVASSRLPGYSGVFNVQLRILPPGEGQSLQKEAISEAYQKKADKEAKRKKK